MKRKRSYKPPSGETPKRSRFQKRVNVKLGAAKTKDAAKPKPETPKSIVGVVTKTPHGWELKSTDRRDKSQYVIKPSGKSGLQDGELVVAEALSDNKGGRVGVKILRSIGDPADARNVSLIAIHTHNIPDVFSEEAVREAEAAKPVTLANRADLRDIPLVTIDGPDARDFDDAVFAEPDKKGWHIVVAIADVAHYVRFGGVLDKDAYARGNSTYFPDRVVPMLPEALSNELCSLKPDVERACLAVHMWLDHEGELTRWKFARGVMKSRARLTYEQVQAAMDGKPDAVVEPLLEPLIKPLYGAFKCLMQARLKRGTLELDLPERKAELGEDGFVRAIKVRERLDSHKLIEEFMIAANVAAAAQLEGKGGICLYRIHDKPNEIKLTALREFLETIGISLVPSKQLHPRMLTQILENASGGPNSQVVNEVMLRSQSQAVYSHENIGHFGLALAKYAHFTSPIRRYADLVVHRGLIRACKLGDDGITEDEIERLAKIAEHISATERRSATAEREVIDRFVTLFMSDKIGAIFPARISGITRNCLFARLDETGADGIIPMHALPRDYYMYDETRQAMVGQRTGRTYQLASRVKVRLEKADKLTGSIGLAVVDDDPNAKDGKTVKDKASVKTARKRRRYSQAHIK